MSATSAPDEAPAPAPAVLPPAKRRGFGSLSSMLISMVVIVAATLAWFVMVPRVREINQPAVDVTSVARQVRQETGWAISQPQLPVGWKATNVRLDTITDGVRTWHAGYLSPEGSYVSIDQTAVTGDAAKWIAARTSSGQAEGTLSAAGRTWQKASARDVVQRSLISMPPVSTVPRSGEVLTVLSGTAPYTQLAQFAETLKLVP